MTDKRKHRKGHKNIDKDRRSDKTKHNPAVSNTHESFDKEELTLDDEKYSYLQMNDFDD